MPAPQQGKPTQQGKPVEHWDAQRLRERFIWLNRFSDDELRELGFCAEDEELEPGETYFDVSHPEQGPLQGLGGNRVPKGSCLVARSRVSPTVWQKLTEPVR